MLLNQIFNKNRRLIEYIEPPVSEMENAFGLTLFSSLYKFELF